ncbi:uncharacterized protein LOC141684836 isoform X2 [Apium graveolens]|uniref:uncharacterized protein LOC141684836 isoform X2 n=1 Tax=Apium graveolens TaxID=4045 RepID=UPI003D7B0BC6
MSAIFAGLVSLRDLKLCFEIVPVQASIISCPQLVNLEIETCRWSEESLHSNIVVMAPKLSNFTSIGIFSITFGISKLETVCIKMQKWHKPEIWREMLKEDYQGFAYMLPRLGSAKILRLDSEAIKALSLVSSFLERFPSPFYNLKYVKLPHGCKETSISAALKSYLIDGSPTATFVTSLHQGRGQKLPGEMVEEDGDSHQV